MLLFRVNDYKNLPDPNCNVKDLTKTLAHESGKWAPPKGVACDTYGVALGSTDSRSIVVTGLQWYSVLEDMRAAWPFQFPRAGCFNGEKALP